jgi:CPA2 family monovalent cation:H+ antiporter-2
MLFQLGVILGVLYLGALLAHKIKQSSVPVFILAGVGLQAFVPHSEIIDFMAQLGVMLLLFMIGLEFSPERLRRGGGKLLLAGGLDALINLPVGILCGVVMGLDAVGALVLGGALYVSSTAIIARNTIEFRRAAHPETEYLLGVSVLEDVVSVLYLSLVVGLGGAEGVRFDHLAWTLLKMIGFFGGALAATLVLPRWLRRLIAHESIEVFLLLVLALIVMFAAVAEFLGLSSAVGAFLAGFILPEREIRERVDRAITPFRDLFAAIFFVSFGLLIDPSGFGRVALIGPIVLLVAVAGKILTGIAIGRLVRLSRAASVRLGIGLIPRGELSILLAGLASEPLLLALTVVIVFASALVGPLLMRWAEL